MECGKTFAKQKQLNYHNKQNHQPTLARYICSNCGCRFNAPYPLRSHLKPKHNVELKLEQVKKFHQRICKRKKQQKGPNLSKEKEKPASSAENIAPEYITMIAMCHIVRETVHWPLLSKRVIWLLVPKSWPKTSVQFQVKWTLVPIFLMTSKKSITT